MKGFALINGASWWSGNSFVVVRVRVYESLLSWNRKIGLSVIIRSLVEIFNSVANDIVQWL